MPSEDEHAVAVAVEAVAFGDGGGVGGFHEVGACHGGDEHEECGFWQVEVSKEGVGAAERPWRVDEDGGIAVVRGDGSVGGGAVFEDAGDGGADGNAAGGGFDGGGGVGGDFVAFAVHDVVGDDVSFDWLERACADVESDGGVGDGGEDFRGEVEPGGGGSDGVGGIAAGVDRLIAFVVLGVVVALHVVREREVAEFLFVGDGVEVDEAGAVWFDGGDGAGAAADGQGMALAHAFTWFDHALPVDWGDGVESEDFDAAVVGEEAGAGDADIVEDDEVALVEEGREVAEAAVFEGLGVPVDDEHARGVALRERAAGDELGREVVVEVVGAEHRGGVRVGVGGRGGKESAEESGEGEVVPAAGEWRGFDVRGGEGADGGEGEFGELETPCGGEDGPDGWGERGEEFVVFAVAEGLLGGAVAAAGDGIGEDVPSGAAGGGEAREVFGEPVAEVHHG